MHEVSRRRFLAEAAAAGAGATVLPQLSGGGPEAAVAQAGAPPAGDAAATAAAATGIEFDPLKNYRVLLAEIAKEEIARDPVRAWELGARAKRPAFLAPHAFEKDWKLIFYLAEVAGGKWPQRALDAAAKLSDQAPPAAG